jgi:hypothetical protein
LDASRDAWWSGVHGWPLLRVGGGEIVAWHNFLRSPRNGKAAAAAETNFEFDGLEGWIYVHDTHWPQPRETSFVEALVQLQLGAGITQKFFEKGKTQDIESRARKEYTGHWPGAM